MTLVLTAGATPASAAKSATCSVKNTGTGQAHKSLQQAVDAAKPGARLVVKGTCVGTTRIDKDLSIEGARTAASRKPTLDGVRKGRVMVVDGGAVVTLIGLVLENGRSKVNCGGLVNRGTLTLRDVVVRQNRARIQGGGICNGGTLVLSGATRVKGNTALWAGGIWNRHGTLSMDDTSSVTGNTCHATGAGVGNFGTMVMNDSSKVSDNHGDGVWVYSAATLTMNDSSSISRNVSSNDAGGVTLGGALTMNDSSSITGNSLAVDDLCWFAAGVSVTNTWGPSRPVSLTMTGSSVIRDNHAPCSAGGISNGVIRPDGLVIPGGTISGVNCAPQTYANVYGNTPDDCRLLWPIEG